MSDQVPVPHVLLLTLIYFKEPLHILSDPIILLTVITPTPTKKRKAFHDAHTLKFTQPKAVLFQICAFYLKEGHDLENNF